MTLVFTQSQWMEDYPCDSGAGPWHADGVSGFDRVGSSQSAALREQDATTDWMLSGFHRHTSTLMSEQLLQWRLHVVIQCFSTCTQRKQNQDWLFIHTVRLLTRSLIPVFLYVCANHLICLSTRCCSSSWCLHTFSMYKRYVLFSSRQKKPFAPCHSFCLVWKTTFTERDDPSQQTWSRN